MVRGSCEALYCLEEQWDLGLTRRNYQDNFAWGLSSMCYTWFFWRKLYRWGQGRWWQSQFGPTPCSYADNVSWLFDVGNNGCWRPLLWTRPDHAGGCSTGHPSCPGGPWSYMGDWRHRDCCTPWSFGATHQKTEIWDCCLPDGTIWRCQVQSNGRWCFLPCWDHYPRTSIEWRQHQQALCDMASSTSQKDSDSQPTTSWWALWQGVYLWMQSILQQYSMAWRGPHDSAISRWWLCLGGNTYGHYVGQSCFLYTWRDGSRWTQQEVFLESCDRATRWRTYNRCNGIWFER